MWSSASIGNVDRAVVSRNNIERTQGPRINPNWLVPALRLHLHALATAHVSVGDVKIAMSVDEDAVGRRDAVANLVYDPFRWIVPQKNVDASARAEAPVGHIEVGSVFCVGQSPRRDARKNWRALQRKGLRTRHADRRLRSAAP